jgi:hypothetical protein
MPEVLTAVVVVVSFKDIVSGSFVDNSLDVVYSLTEGVEDVSLVLSISIDGEDDVSMYTSVAIVDARILMSFKDE